MNITIYDPLANKEDVMHEYNLEATQEIPKSTFYAIVLTVAHTAFLEMNFDSILNKNYIIYDVNIILPSSKKDGGL